MLKDCEFNDRTMIIVSLAFCVGVGLTQTDANFFSAFPQAVGDIFNGNAVAGVFVVSLLLSLILPKDKSEKVEEITNKKKITAVIEIYFSYSCYFSFFKRFSFTIQLPEQPSP